MRKSSQVLAIAGAALATSMLLSSNALAAQAPSISGDKWVAYAIIGGLIGAIVLFVFASVGIERRDEANARTHKHHSVLPGLPTLGDDEDGDDA